MKRGRLPLTALRSFEAAGRHASVSRAADELYVSQAAVSRQIRELETLVGRSLFQRNHRQIVLTESGRRLLDQLTSSFDAIDRRLGEVMERPAQHVVTVSVEPSLAAGWLVPRLYRFNQIRPDVDVAIDASPLLVDFRGHRIDLAIRYGATARSWPRTQSRHLADCIERPILAPSMLAAGPPLEKAADLRHYTLLHVDNRDGWSDWFRAAGCNDMEPGRGPIFPDSALAAQSAVRGHGVALGCWLLSGADLMAGRLVAPIDCKLPAGAYWLVAPDLDGLSEPVAAFADWLCEELAETLASERQ